MRIRPLVLTLAVLVVFPSLVLAQADSEQLSRRNEGVFPQPGQVLTVTVGQSVIQEFDQTEYLYAEARTELRGGGKVLMPKGGRLWGKSVEGQTREFCDVDLPGSVCFTDGDGNGTFDKVKIVGGSRVDGVSGSYREEWSPGVDGGRRWELIYLGAAGGVLRLSSREWNGATAPLQNEVTYDLSPTGPTRFRYRSVEIEVLSADNSGLKYRVSLVTTP